MEIGKSLTIFNSTGNPDFRLRNDATNKSVEMSLDGDALKIDSPGGLKLGEAKTSPIYEIRKTIGVNAETGCDYNLTAAAASTEQVIELDDVLPPFARVLDVAVVTKKAFVSSEATFDMTVEAGNASSGAQYLAHTTVKAIDTILAAANSLSTVAVNKAATSVYFSFKPSVNASTFTKGVVEVVITYYKVV